MSKFKAYRNIDESCEIPDKMPALIGRFPDIPQMLERAVKGKFDGKVVIYPHLNLKHPIETAGKWDRDKEEALFESMLPD